MENKQKVRDMAKIIYLKKDTKSKFVEFPEPLNPEQFNNIGTTWQDYEDNLWVRLNDEQVAFYEEHPNAIVKDVWNMELGYVAHVQERTLEVAKTEKIQDIIIYDNSDTINSFSIAIGENTISTWITPSQRSNYKNSLDSAELLGLTEVHPVFNGVQFTIPLQTAKTALAQIQIYADRCYNITEQHKNAVNSLNTIEAVDSYDYTVGYPEKLIFELPSE